MAWDGFNQSVSGLFASQNSLYVTAHNIANVNNKNYSRQLVTQSATSPQTLPGVGMMGSGTNITDIYRVRDEYINHKYWNENGKHGVWETKKQSIADIEMSFNEPTDSSIRQITDNLYTAIEQLSTNASSYASKSYLRETGVTFAGQLNEMSRKLYTIQKELNFQVDVNVEKINDFSMQIADINKQIAHFELDGTKANDLRDKRDGLVDSLSKIVNVETNETDGKFSVSIGGMSLVDNLDRKALEIKKVDNAINPEEKISKILWADSGLELKVEDGNLKGLLEVRGDGTLDGVGSGENQTYRGIAYYTNRLNEFASTFALRLNELHTQGFGENGSTGLLMFTTDGKATADIKINGKAVNELDLKDKTSADYKAFEAYFRTNVRADNISLSSDLKSNLENIAVSDKKDGKENGNNLLAMLKQREDRLFFDSPTAQGPPDEFVKAIVSTVAVDSQQAIRMEKNEASIIKNILQRRMSDSGVNSDEEAANMIKYQQAYKASARMIQTMDEIYGVIVNQLGLSGR